MFYDLDSLNKAVYNDGHIHKKEFIADEEMPQEIAHDDINFRSQSMNQDQLQMDMPWESTGSRMYMKINRRSAGAAPYMLKYRSCIATYRIWTK